MRYSENRKLAFAVLVVCVVVSIFGLGGLGLARERGKVLTVYDRGADTSLATRHSVDAYLDSAGENATLMASEAGLHMDASPLIDNVAQLGQKVATEADTNARFEASEALKTAVDQLYDAMYQAAQGDDCKNFKVAYDNFWENVKSVSSGQLLWSQVWSPMPGTRERRGWLAAGGCLQACTGKDRVSFHTGGAPALRPGAISPIPGRVAALCRASLPKACPASSVRAREGAGCGSVGAVSGA